MRYLPLLLLLLFFSCKPSKKKSKPVFTTQELSLISAYHPGDTIWFQNSKGDMDTFVVASITGAQMLRGRKENENYTNMSCQVVIKHLPYDRYSADTAGQALITVSKLPGSENFQYVYAYRGFISQFYLNKPGQHHADTILVNAIPMTDFYEIDIRFPLTLKADDDIATIYWNKTQGLCAYKNVKGEYWTRR